MDIYNNPGVFYLQALRPYGSIKLPFPLSTNFLLRTSPGHIPHCANKSQYPQHTICPVTRLAQLLIVINKVPTRRKYFKELLNTGYFYITIRGEFFN